MEHRTAAARALARARPEWGKVVPCAGHCGPLRKDCCSCMNAFLTRCLPCSKFNLPGDGYSAARVRTLLISLHFYRGRISIDESSHADVHHQTQCQKNKRGGRTAVTHQRQRYARYWHVAYHH